MRFFRSALFYVSELAIFFALAYAAGYLANPSKATFLAGLSLFFLLGACLIDRPAAPHMLLRLFARPMNVLMFVVVVGFAAFGTREPDLTVFAPGFALSMLGAAFANRIEKSRHKRT
jgi:hypothetical protein